MQAFPLPLTIRNAQAAALEERFGYCDSLMKAKRRCFICVLCALNAKVFHPRLRSDIGGNKLICENCHSDSILEVMTILSILEVMTILC